MHHNRSLLPNVEVLLGVMVKTSTCSNKLLFVILNFYSRLFSRFWSNFTISTFLTKFHNFNLNFEFQLDFINLIKFHNLAKNPENGQFLQWIYIWNVLDSAPPSSSCKILQGLAAVLKTKLFKLKTQNSSFHQKSTLKPQ